MFTGYLIAAVLVCAVWMQGCIAVPYSFDERLNPYDHRSVARSLDISPRSSSDAAGEDDVVGRLIEDDLEEDLSLLMDSLVVHLVASCRRTATSNPVADDDDDVTSGGVSLGPWCRYVQDSMCPAATEDPARARGRNEDVMANKHNNNAVGDLVNVVQKRWDDVNTCMESCGKKHALAPNVHWCRQSCKRRR